MHLLVLQVCELQVWHVQVGFKIKQSNQEIKKLLVIGSITIQGRFLILNLIILIFAVLTDTTLAWILKNNVPNKLAFS